MRRILLLSTLLIIQNVSSQHTFTDTQGALEVSSAGAAVYTLPIAMPPSAGDVGPVINLVYNSGRFGGIAGQGWSINSISTISRIATRKDIDGYTDGVDFDKDDKLALDGQRLLLKSGLYWEEGATYQTETHANTKIKMMGSGDSRYFIVTAPDGSRFWYGNYNGADATEVNAWYISRFEDPNANVMTYQYTRVAGGSLCISAILFSGHASEVAPINSIRFFYKPAKRTEFAYIKGQQYKKTALLDRIKVHSGTALFRSYVLSHQTDPQLGYEKLVRIQEFNPEIKGANPIIFQYNHTTTESSGSEYKTTYNNPLNFQKIRHSGDFDGDGRLDFITNNKLYTRTFTGESGPVPIDLPFELSRENPSMVVTTLSDNKLNPFQSVAHCSISDFTLNISMYQLQSNPVRQSYSKSLALINTTTKSGCIEGGTQISASTPYYYLEGDFNGDGISELLFVTDRDKNIHHTEQDVYGTGTDEDIIIGTRCERESVTDSGHDLFWVDLHPDRPNTLGSSGYVQLTETEIFNFSHSQFSKKYVLDFNGDGRSDILSIQTDKSYQVIGFRELSEAPYMALELLGEGTLPDYKRSKQLLFGDFNGDGKADLILPKAERSSKWVICYANPKPEGGDFFSMATHDIIEYWPNSKGYYKTQTHFRNYYAMDTNGDGKSDLVEV